MSRSRPRAVVRTGLALTVTALAVLALVPGTSAAASSGGSALATSFSAAQAEPTLTGIRTGRHAGFDRIVLDMTGRVPTIASNRAVPYLVQDPTGDDYFLNGEHFTEVSISGAATYDMNYQPVYPGPNRFRTPALTNVMAIGITGDFERHLTIGIGARTRTAVTVFPLSSPTRVVIDVRS